MENLIGDPCGYFDIDGVELKYGDVVQTYDNILDRWENKFLILPSENGVKLQDGEFVVPLKSNAVKYCDDQSFSIESLPLLGNFTQRTAHIHFNDLTYNGKNFLDYYVHGEDVNVCEDCEAFLQIGETVEYDDFDESVRDNIRGQLEYIGYLPQEDKFVFGFSITQGYSNTVLVKILQNSAIVSNLNGIHTSGNFYADEGYDRVKEKYSDIIDLLLK